MRTPLAIALAFALAVPAAAQTGSELLVIPSKNSIRTYVFKKKQNGKMGLRGRVQKVAGQKVTLTVYDGPATWDEHRDLSVFTPSSAFRIMQVVTPDTAEAQLDLARWGLDRDVPIQARYALRTARGLAKDPNLGAGLDKAIREKTAAQLKSRFQYNLAQGKIRTAEQSLRELNRHYADVVGANVRAQMKTSLEARETEFKKERQDKRAKDAVAQKDKEFQRKLKPIRLRVERGQTAMKKGLNAGSSMSKALGSFRRATQDLDYAARSCDRLKKKYGNDGRYNGDINYLQEQAVNSLTDALLHSASILTSRGSFNKALGNVNKVLARDAKNTRRPGHARPHRDRRKRGLGRRNRADRQALTHPRR